MPLFGGSRDFNFVKLINNEFINKIVEQTIAYIKISLTETPKPNIYGESDGKVYYNPVLINCIINNSPQSPSIESKLPTVTRNITFNFFREHLVEKDILPEKGDIILWNNDYYEVYNLMESELFLGKNPDYIYNENTKDFGGSISIKLECVYINPEKLPFTIDRI